LSEAEAVYRRGDALGNRAASDQALAELIEKFPTHPTDIAEVYARRGDADAAVQWLERAFAQRDAGLPCSD